jgi:hypothetical protein
MTIKLVLILSMTVGFDNLIEDVERKREKRGTKSVIYSSFLFT